jgi:hypothetical protein
MELDKGTYLKKNVPFRFSYPPLYISEYAKQSDSLYNINLKSKDVSDIDSRVSRLNKITSLLANISISSTLGYYEWEIYDKLAPYLHFTSLSDPWYQTFLTIGFSIGSMFTSKLIHYIGNKISKARSKPSGMDYLFNTAGSLLSFDGGAVVRGIRHGINIGYWGKANRDHIVHSPIGKVALDEMKIGNTRLGISWTMFTVVSSLSLYLLDKIKPIGKLGRIKKYGNKISKTLLKSRKRRYAAEWLVGGILAASAGIPGLAPTLFICDLVDEGSNRLMNKLREYKSK